MKRTTLSTALYVALVFLSGAVVGGFAHRLYMVSSVLSGPANPPKPEDVRRQYLEEMRVRLSLSKEQVKQVNAILDSTRARYHEVKNKWDHEARLNAKPELKAIQQDQIQKIKAILSETQQPEYDKYRAEREKKRQEQNKKTTSPAS